jgi:hypothetical protein
MSKKGLVSQGVLLLVASGAAVGAAACNQLTGADQFVESPCYPLPPSQCCAAEAGADASPDAAGDSTTSDSAAMGDRADASDGGAGDSGASAMDADAAGCTTGSMTCTGTQPQECVAGVWIRNGAACAGTNPVCLDGGCVTCAPDAVQCDQQQPQKCDSTGAWQANGMACTTAETCTAGACGGLCGPGQPNCNGQQPQSCDGTGHWQDVGMPCPTSQTCVGGSCTGQCGPGQATCIGSTPQSCGSNGMWVAGTPCQYVCTGSGQCTGECTPGAAMCTNVGGRVPQATASNCNSSGQWDKRACPVCLIYIGSTSYPECSTGCGTGAAVCLVTSDAGTGCVCP